MLAGTQDHFGHKFLYSIKLIWKYCCLKPTIQNKKSISFGAVLFLCTSPLYTRGFQVALQNCELQRDVKRPERMENI